MAASLPSVTIARGDLWMLAGFVVLGWVLARTTIQRRKRIAAEKREQDETQRRLESERQSAAPLSDAPPEVQRWQVAMFELQRELKGELDSRIAIVQGLLRQVDERLSRVDGLKSERDSNA
ncbi:MAG: hypothetical protein AAF745_10410 [Planctomycetota bacterium]